MSKKHIKLLDKPVNFWVKVHIIGYLILFSSLGTYPVVNQIAFNKKQKENPKAILENGMAAQKTAKKALTAQAALGATVVFGGLAMWRKKEKQYE
ncbi:MAG: hypothetical protein J6W41_02125 [Alphaproteobacteria bacterium]|nr:hypothetical protein [Alphaproteobacteria bacterium]